MRTLMRTLMRMTATQPKRRQKTGSADVDERINREVLTCVVLDWQNSMVMGRTGSLMSIDM